MKGYMVKWTTALSLCCLLGILGAMVTPSAPAYAWAKGMPAYTIHGRYGAVSMPGVLPAGYVRITFVNNGKHLNELQFFRLHHGVTDKRFLAALNSRTNGEAVYAVASAAGGVNQLMPRLANTVIVRLRTGSYVVVAFGATGGSIIGHFQVKVLAQSDFAVPGFNTQITLRNYQIGVTNELKEPEHLVVRVVNLGPSTHELSLARVPAGTTRGEIIACVKERTPDAKCQKLMGAMAFLGGSGAIAPHTAERLDLDLTPGTYAAMCFVPNMMNMPHAALGMVTVFVVQSHDTDGDGH